MEHAVAVEFAFRGGFKRLDGRGSFVAEQRAQAERWCCFGFAVVSKWWASQWSLSGMRGGDCGLHRLILLAQTQDQPESQRRTAAAAARAFFRPPTHPVFSGIGRGLERGASSMATTGQCWPRHGAWGAGDTCPLPPPLFLLITPTQQPRRHQRRLKALVGAEPAESPEGHAAGD